MTSFNKTAIHSGIVNWRRAAPPQPHHVHSRSPACPMPARPPPAPPPRRPRFPRRKSASSPPR
ncbi:hypothetical protein EMIT0158MI4_20354 [Burkholderia ambifaria]